MAEPSPAVDAIAALATDGPDGPVPSTTSNTSMDVPGNTRPPIAPLNFFNKTGDSATQINISHNDVTYWKPTIYVTGPQQNSSDQGLKYASIWHNVRKFTEFPADPTSRNAIDQMTDEAVHLITWTQRANVEITDPKGELTIYYTKINGGGKHVMTVEAESANKLIPQLMLMESVGYFETATVSAVTMAEMVVEAME